MNIRKILLIIIAIIIVAFAFSLLNKEDNVLETPINIEVGQVFTGIELAQTKYVLNYKIWDLNADSVNDVIIFIGEKDSVDSIFAKNIDIVLYDGALQKYINAGLKKFEGEAARIELSDLTGDSIKDIVAILNRENGEKNIRVVTLEEDTLKEIFKDKNNKYITFSGSFIDGFKVNITNKKLNVNKEIDLKNMSKSLIENGVFDESGKYIINDNSKIRTTGFIELEFVQLTGSMGIKTKQRIITVDTKNIIDEVSIIWKFEDGKWQIKEAVGIKLGNLLY